MQDQAPIADADIVGRSLSGLGWAALGTGGQAVAQFLVLVILARLLTPAEFGVATAATAISGLVLVFSQVGVGPAIIQRADLEPEHIRVGFTLSSLLGALLGVGFFVAIPLISDVFPLPGFRNVLSILAWSFPIQGAGAVALALLHRRLEIRQVALIQLCSFIGGYGAVAISMASTGFGAEAIAAATVAQSAVQTGMSLFLARHSVQPCWGHKTLRELSYYGGGLTIGRLGNYLALQGDNAVVARMMGADALGFYGRAYQLTTLPASLFHRIVDGVLFPALSAVQNDPVRLSRAFVNGSAIVALMTMPAGAVALVLAPEIVFVVLGKNWVEATSCFQALCLSMWLRTSYKMSDSLARSTGHVYRRAWRQIVYAAAVVLAAAFGSRHGITGVAIGVFCAIALNFLLMTHLSLKTINLSWHAYVMAHRPALLSSVLLGAAAEGAAAFLRQAEVSPGWTIAGTIAVLLPLGTALIAKRALFDVFVGPEGKWLWQRVWKRTVQSQRQRAA